MERGGSGKKEGEVCKKTEKACKKAELLEMETHGIKNEKKFVGKIKGEVCLKDGNSFRKKKKSVD